MRVLDGTLCVLLILFAAVQYNDPDPFLWGSIYGVGAMWTGIAAFKPTYLGRPSFRILLGLSVLAGIFGLIWSWPQTPGWWHVDIWWETETAKEGMGMMFVVASLLICAGTAASQWRKSGRHMTR